MDLSDQNKLVAAKAMMKDLENEFQKIGQNLEVSFKGMKTSDYINPSMATALYAEIDQKASVRVFCDGVAKTSKAGDILRLAPGESVTLSPGNWHKFWGENGDVLIGEVSTVNDDIADNIFAESIGRFSEIDEDTDPIHLLVSDYEKWCLL